MAPIPEMDKGSGEWVNIINPSYDGILAALLQRYGENEHAVTNYWKLKAIDSFEISAAIDGIAKDECNKIIETLIDNQEIKKILIAKLC